MDKLLTIQMDPSLDRTTYLTKVSSSTKTRKRGRCDDSIKSPLLKHLIVKEKKEKLMSLISL